jgi:hypothetical protein
MIGFLLSWVGMEFVKHYQLLNKTRKLDYDFGRIKKIDTRED